MRLPGWEMLGAVAGVCWAEAFSPAGVGARGQQPAPACLRRSCGARHTRRTGPWRGRPGGCEVQSGTIFQQAHEAEVSGHLWAGRLASSTQCTWP